LFINDLYLDRIAINKENGIKYRINLIDVDNCVKDNIPKIFISSYAIDKVQTAKSHTEEAEVYLRTFDII
jgi:hypothetical protein